MDYTNTAPVVPLNTGKKSPTKGKDTKKKSGDEIIINPVEKQDGAINERFLNVAQRIKRGQQMRRREPILKLKKAIAKFRPHTKAQLKQKASQIAKSAARRRFAGARGASYETLGRTDKVTIDRSLESKSKLIQKMARRLAPQLRAADTSRLVDVRRGKRAKALKKYLRGGMLTQSFSLEDVGKLYDHLTEKDIHALEQKSNRSGVSFETIKEIFAQGLSESTKQSAFDRVNAFIATVVMKEAHHTFTPNDGTHTNSNGHRFAGNSWNENGRKHATIYQHKDTGKYYAERITANTTYHDTPEDAARAYGSKAKKKSVTEGAKSPMKRFEGTKTLVKAYKKDTPGEVMEASSVEDEIDTSDFKLDKRGRKVKAHKVIFKDTEANNG